MGRVSTLTAAREALAPRAPDLECSGLPKLDPRLILIYQPHRSAQPPAPDPVRELLASIRRVWPVLAAPAPGPLGQLLTGAPREGLPVVAPGPLGELLIGAPREGLPVVVAGPLGHLLTGAPREGLPVVAPGPLGELLTGAPREGLPVVAPGPLGELLIGGPREGLPLPVVVGGPLGAAGGGCWLSGPPREGPGCWGPAQPGPLGLSEAQNPQKGTLRYGKGGLSANGARQIQRACAVLQDERASLAFWTVTLPDATIRQLVGLDLWPQFQTRIRDLLIRALGRAGLPARVVGVVELHPSRSMRERIPLPHLHVVFQGRRNGRGAWALSTEQLDRIIRDAVRYVGLDAPDVRAAGNVQPVRKNCGAYLAKYMAKNREGAWLKQVPGNLPRVWWFWSKALRAEVLALVVEVCWSFVSWLHRLGPLELEGIGAVRCKLDLSDPRAPATWCVRWRREDGLRRATVLWATDENRIKLRGVSDLLWQP